MAISNVICVLRLPNSHICRKADSKALKLTAFEAVIYQIKKFWLILENDLDFIIYGVFWRVSGQSHRLKRHKLLFSLFLYVIQKQNFWSINVKIAEKTTTSLKSSKGK